MNYDWYKGLSLIWIDFWQENRDAFKKSYK